ADDVYLSSAPPGQAGGLRISTDVYVVGFASATRFYGDGSQLTGLPGDHLGNHTAEMDLNMGPYAVVGAGQAVLSSFTATGYGITAALLHLAANVDISSEASANLGAGMRVSSNVYIVGFASATKYFGDGSELTGIGGEGSALDADTLDTLDSLDFVRKTDDIAETVTGAKVFTSSLNITEPLGLGAAQVRLSDNVAISSEALAINGAGMRISSNVYIVGFSSAAKYYGDGSELTGIGGTGSGLDADLLDGLDSTDFVRKTGNVAETVTGAKTFVSSVTVSAAAGIVSARLGLFPGVALSSATAAQHGGVYVSTHVALAAGAKYYGDGSQLTGVVAEFADNLSNGQAGELPYQSAPNTTAMLGAGTPNYLLQANGAAAPGWTNAPTILGTNITGVPAASIAAGSLGSGVIASSIAVNAVYPAAVRTGTYGVDITGNAATATRSTNLAGGALGRIPYQSSANTTAMLAAGQASYVLTGAGTAAPVWTRATYTNTANAIVKRNASGDFKAGIIEASLNGNAATANTATNLAGGAVGQVHYQTAPGNTGMLAAGALNSILQAN
ncbi:MAG: hypothetical protein COT18_10765, partial [Elusimicrobia bacterium CG08_land_8_20_14_0_20_59_10]